MKGKIFQMALLVRDYDEAIQYYTQTLGFQLIEDTVLSDTKRWVVISTGDGEGTRLLLAKAANSEQESRVGNQTGGRVFLFLHTDHFDDDYQQLLDRKVEIVRGPAAEPYGRVLVFRDIYGNLWDLIGPSTNLK